MTRLELLAPAKTAEIGIAAIRCGADAVYIGGPAFGARAAAGNSVDDIRKLCLEAKPFGVRIFVTVNTLARDEGERNQAVALIRSMRGCGVSAFIIQDTTLMPLLQADGPWEEEFHASTQCAIRTPERAAFLSGLGFSRLILERELSLEQIRAIRAAVPAQVELEFFVHGAVCVCYSGDCYLSELLTGRSANRGECAQPCRNLYDLVDGSGRTLVKGKPLLSLKDLKLDGRLEDLAEAGITSFKIEGRLKNETYVKNVVRAYSEALDALIGQHPDCWCRASRGTIRGGFRPNLDKTFNRGYTTLYLDGKKDNWNSGDAAKGMGQLLGTVKRCSAGSLQLSAGAPAVHNGDGLCHIGADGQVEGFRADRAEGPVIWGKGAAKLHPGEKIWRNRDNAFEREVEANTPQRLLRAALKLSFAEGSLLVEARCENGATLQRSFDVSSAPAAANRERMLGMLSSQLEKTSGLFIFNVESISAPQAGLPLMGASAINSLRREMAADLERCITGQQKAAGMQTADQDAGRSIPVCLPQDLSHPRLPGELMRTRYCILAQMGKCLKSTAGAAIRREPLYLENNGRRIALHFDCASCEMVLEE